MKRLFWLSFILLGVITAVQSASTAVGQVQMEASNNCPGTNLLINPSFEGVFSAYNPPGGHPSCPWGPCMTAQVAAGWTPWWRIHNENDPEYIMRMPEFKPAEAYFTNPDRVRSGERAQQYFTFYSTHEAGLLQQATAVVGERYCLSVWGHSWSAQDSDDAWSGPEQGELHQKVGIDPTGGTDWLSPHIVWSDPGLGRIQSDLYGEFVTTAVAQNNIITIFLYSQPRWAVKHNDVYWDDARLTRDGVVFTEQQFLPLVLR